MEPLTDPAVNHLIERLSELADVRAVAVTGSHAHGRPRADSDLDLFVYSETPLLSERRAIADALASPESPVLVNVDPFSSGDVWRTEAGTWIDAQFWKPSWAEDQLDKVLVRNEPSLGYSTALCQAIATARPLYERDAWHPALQERARSPYPDALVTAIVDYNLPWLDRHPFSFRHQVDVAIAQSDPVSVNHRLAAWLSSFFDVVLAVNRVLHPGEKRLLDVIEAKCALKPDDLRATVETAVSATDPRPQIEQLLTGLDAIL